MGTEGNARLESRIASVRRWRAGLIVAALIVPTALFALFERQARRLDALATRGESAVAEVMGTSSSQSITFYAYRVNGNEYSWNVARAEAPFAPGATFPVLYLPDDPSLSRPGSERSLVTHQAAENRRLAWKLCLGAGLVLFGMALLVHRDLVRLRRSTAPLELSAAAYRQRLVFTALALLLIFLGIGAFHLRQARERGESMIPGLVALSLSAGLLGSVFFYAGRDGPQKATERSARLLRWVAPLAFGVALLRLLALYLAK